MADKPQVRSTLPQIQPKLKKRRRLKWSKYRIQRRESTRKRTSAFIVENSDIGRTNAENVLLKRKLKTRTRAHGTAQWDKEAQRYTPLAWPMSPTWLSHKNYLNRIMKVCGVWIVERTSTCCHTTTHPSITSLSSTTQSM